MVLDPQTCEGDILGNKSHLDLKRFGVGVIGVGRKVIPYDDVAQRQVR